MTHLRSNWILLVFAAALVTGVGCNHDDDEIVIPNLAGQYALDEVLTTADDCALGDPLAVPIRVTQSGRAAVLTNGTVPGPDVCGAESEGNVTDNRVLPATGETVFPDYWAAGCNLVQTDDWSLTISASGVVTGSWSVGYRDDPPGCSGAGAFFPCTNNYDVTGSACAGCFAACPSLKAGAPGGSGSTWGRR